MIFFELKTFLREIAVCFEKKFSCKEWGSDGSLKANKVKKKSGVVVVGIVWLWNVDRGSWTQVTIEIILTSPGNAGPTLASTS